MRPARVPARRTRARHVMRTPLGFMAFERISADPRRMNGLTCVRDTRVTVSAVLGQLAAGRSVEQILDDYPYLERDDVLAALEFAAAVVADPGRYPGGI